MGDAWHLRRAEFERWGVQVRSSNYILYGDLSARVVRVLGDFTPDLEVLILPDDPRRIALMDALNAHYGKDRVRYTASGTDQPWKLRAEHLSQRYTTQWSELLSI